MDKPVFTKDQMISSTEVTRKFSETRKKAKKYGPLGIMERGGLSSVLMDYDQYEQMYLRLQDLEEKMVEMTVLRRAQELKDNPSSAIPWRSVRRTDQE